MLVIMNQVITICKMNHVNPLPWFGHLSK